MSLEPRPRLLVAEDHDQVREGLRLLLSGEFEVVQAVADGQALLEAAARTQADAVVLDISMPRLNGIEAARRLARTYPEIRLVFITNHADPEYVQAAMDAGGHGYVIKTELASHLIEAVHLALAGGRFVSPSVDVQWSRAAPPLVAADEGVAAPIVAAPGDPRA